MSHTGPVQQLYLEFGRLLREARTAADLTQQEVAGRVGLTRTSITNIERGSQHISLHQLFLLANAVGRNPTDLLPSDAVDLKISFRRPRTRDLICRKKMRGSLSASCETIPAWPAPC